VHDDDDVAAAAVSAPLEDPPAVAGGPRRRPRRLLTSLAATAAVALLALAVGIAVARPAPEGALRERVVPLPSPSASPYNQAVDALRVHGNALVDGDEQGWLAAVDSAQAELLTRYRGMFGSLRELGVTKFRYDAGIAKPDKKDPSILTFPVQIFYCYGLDTCRGEIDIPEVRQTLTMRPIDGHYVISRSVIASDPHLLGPAPWQDGRLVFADGQRVVLAADPAEAKYLPTVLPLAEKAAVVDDKFATMLKATQTKYRIFLAGEKQWHTWYGGEDDDWVIGLAVPIGAYGLDVVLRIDAIHDTRELQVTLQHELGHVVTLTGSAWAGTASQQWLTEGIAEYIGWSPLPATSSFRRPSVRWALRGGQGRTSMIPQVPGRAASNRAGDAFYGLSHFAVDCMAHKYGQQDLFTFVRHVLSYGETYDEAARAAYGAPFAKVDRACVTWIRQQA